MISSCTNPDYQLEQGTVVVKIDPMYYRPTEVDLLVGDATKCRQKLNWTPKYDLNLLIAEMMASDLKLFKTGGFEPFNTNE